MGWRSVIITQHAKLTYSMNMMIVQTRDGVNQIPIDDINLPMVVGIDIENMSFTLLILGFLSSFLITNCA